MKDPLNSSSSNPGENPTDPISKKTVISPLVLHFYRHHLGSGHCHLLPRSLVLTHASPASSHSTLCSIATEIILKSESSHSITSSHQLPHHHIFSFICPEDPSVFVHHMLKVSVLIKVRNLHHNINIKLPTPSLTEKAFATCMCVYKHTKKAS